MVKRANQKPDVILLECMMTSFDPGANHNATLNIIGSPVFRTAKWLPILRPSWRPSSVLYTQSKLTRERGVAESSPDRSGQKLAPQFVVPADTTTEEQDRWKIKTIETIAGIASEGTRCISLRLPLGGASLTSDSRFHDLGDSLSETYGMTVIDTVQIIRQRGLEISFSDNVHLRSNSARVVSQIIREALRQNLENGESK
jgi:hypothetical protein